MLPCGCRTIQPEEEKLPVGGGEVDTMCKKPAEAPSTRGEPEENGDTGSVDPAAAELIHQRQFPAMQTTTVMVPPCPSFSILLPAFLVLLTGIHREGSPPVFRQLTQVRRKAVGRDPSHLSGPVLWSAWVG